MRQKITFFGNCQGGALKSLLDSTEIFQKHFEISKIPVHAVKPNKINKIIDKIKQSDYFIHQPVGKYKGIKELSSDYLQQILCDRVRAISFPSIYFNGYTPYAVHLKKRDGSRFVPLQNNSDIHDRNILQAFYEGKTIEQTYQMITNNDFYSQESSLKSVSNGIKELQRREQEQNLDIVVSDIISNNYKKTLLFNTVNHPTLELLRKVAIKIASKIGVELDERTTEWTDILRSYSLCIYPSTYKNLGLEFPYRPYYKYNNETVDVRENIKKTFTLYQLNKDEIEYAVAGIKAHDFVVKTFDLDSPQFIEQANKEIGNENSELNKQFADGKLSRKQYIQNLHYNTNSDKKLPLTFYIPKQLNNPSNSQLYVIFAGDGTSTQYMSNALNKLPNYECFGAAFHRKTMWIPFLRKQEFINWLKNKYNILIAIGSKPFEDKNLVQLVHRKPELFLKFLQESSSKKYTGFKVFPKNLSFPQICDLILSNRQIKKIIIKRNLLETYISNQLITKKTQHKNKSDNDLKISIDKNDFEKWYQETNSYCSNIENYLIEQDCQWSEFHYEDLNSLTESNKDLYIYNWLTRQGFEVSTIEKKFQNLKNHNYLDLIKNSEDFIDFLEQKNLLCLLD